MLNSNRLPGGTMLAPPLNLNKPSEFKVVPAEKESTIRRGEAKDNLIKTSEQILDDIELYGLIVTNDLYKISRNQEILSKADFSSDFIDFRRRLYKNIEKTGDMIINIMKKMKDEFKATKKNINDKMKIKLKGNKNSSTLIEEHFNKLKEKITKGAAETDDYINDAGERIHTMIDYLNPPELKVELEEPESRQFDWEKRLRRRGRIRVLKKYNLYLDERLRQVVLEIRAERDEMVRQANQKMLFIQRRKPESEEERKKKIEEEQKVRIEMERKQKDETEMFIKVLNETVVPNEGMIPLTPNPYAKARRLKTLERQKTLINEIDNKDKSVSFNDNGVKASVDNQKTYTKKKSIMKKDH